MQFKPRQENKQHLFEENIEDQNIIDRIIKEAVEFEYEKKFEIFVDGNLISQPQTSIERPVQIETKVEEPQNIDSVNQPLPNVEETQKTEIKYKLFVIQDRK